MREQPDQAAPAAPGELPPMLSAAFTEVTGEDATQVPVHTGGAAAQRAEANGALALAEGGEVWLPSSALGDPNADWMIAHELAHVVLGHVGEGEPARRVVTAGGYLKRGAKGAAVERLQEQLVTLGYLSAADMATGPGIFGPRTHAAVVAFQAASRLPTEGLVGPRTQAALAAALAARAGGGEGGGAVRGGATLTGRPALREGDESVVVKELQRRLNRYGASLYVDGEFGPATAKAVRAFQTANGFTADGVVGPDTATALVGESARRIGQNQPSPDRGGTAPSPGPSPDVDVDDADPKGILRSSKMNPTVKQLATDTVQAMQAKGYAPYVVDGFRSFEAQDNLYAKGRTKSGPVVTYVRGGGSWHNYGLAVDICFWNKRHTAPTWDAPMKDWRALGAEGKAAGFTRWMGDEGWDFAHFEHHPKWGNTASNLASTYRSDGLQAVWDKVI
jgi:peptidoglycan hydrolase-like protein with peptidoglycan-binding domain